MTSTQPRLSRPNYRPDIDGLRAVAVLSILSFHAFPSWMKGGFIGVDVFFVISGFLISTIIFEALDRGTFSFTAFYARRIRRIFPALILVLVVSYALGWFLLLVDEYKQLGKHIAAGTGFISNFVMWRETGYFDNSAETKPLLHLWSLGVEEQFYIVWPLLLWLAWKWKFNLLTITVIVAIVSFYLNLNGVSKDPVATFYSPQTRFWELLCGSLLAWASIYKKDAPADIKKKVVGWVGYDIYRHIPEVNGKIRDNVFSWFGLFLLAYGFCHINEHIPFPGQWAIVPVLGSVSIISAGANAWVNRNLLSNKVAVWFGLISFPLYLWHWPLLSFVKIIESESPSRAIRIAIGVLSIVLAWLTYNFLERPIRLQGSSKANVALLVLTTLFIGIVGFLTYKNHGISPRSTSLIKGGERKLLKYDFIVASHPNYIEQMTADRQVAIRAPYCQFNNPDQTFDAYRLGISDCLKIVSDKKNVLIIGDSHAADLYVALKETHHHLNLLQVTGAGCMAIRSRYRDKDDPCRRLIDYGIEFAKKNKLDYVLLASRWPNDFSGLVLELDALKEAGQRVILMGPPVEFKKDVNKFLSRRSGDDGLVRLSPRFINREKITLNERMAEFAKKNNVPFVDRISLFCDIQRVCNLVADNGELYIWDYGHLSRTGAKYLGERLLERDYFR